MSKTVRIKVCGITTPEQADAAFAVGVDAIGLVFVKASPRRVNTAQAQSIAATVGVFSTKVALFANPTVAEVAEVLDSVPVDVLQFHGDESLEFCQQFKRPYLKAVRVKSFVGDNNLAAARARQRETLREAASTFQHLLLDAHSDKALGGTGESFDWQCIQGAELGQWVLAGGLAPDNVADAIAQTQPYGVDVSSGVESAPGIKSAEKIRQFVEAVRGRRDK